MGHFDHFQFRGFLRVGHFSFFGIPEGGALLSFHFWGFLGAGHFDHFRFVCFFSYVGEFYGRVGSILEDSLTRKLKVRTAETLNPKPQTLNPNPYPLNPKPSQTPDPNP